MNGEIKNPILSYKSMQSMQYKIFGCKTNKYFTDQWAESSFLRDKKGVFVGSCIVTDKAKSKWIRFVKQQLQTLGE